MQNPLQQFRSGWNHFVQYVTGDDSSGRCAPVMRELLEDRVLYDASPLASLLSPPADSLNVGDSFENQITDLMDLVVDEATDSYGLLVESGHDPYATENSEDYSASGILEPEMDATNATDQENGGYLAVALAFEQNLGQTDELVDFVARGSGYTVFLTEGEAVISLGGEGDSHTLRMNLVGGNSSATVSGVDRLGSTSNYLIGNDSEDWQTDVGNYGRVQYSEVYDGIDVQYYGKQRQLEYDFIVNPGAAVDEIRMSFEGSQSLRIAETGELVITLNEDGDEIRFQAPYSYQDTPEGRQVVESNYVIHADGTVGFEVGEYDASQTLVIDPILDYSTLLGGMGNDAAYRITEDGAGNVYILGQTQSADFPATTGSLSGSADIYIAKLTPNGGGASDLVYATYIGGSGTEYGTGGIHVNGAGEVIFLGSTRSTDYVTTAGAYDTTLGGSADAVIGKLNAAGNTLLYSSYYGGSAGGEAAGGMAVDASGNVYITGQTLSNNLPTVNAYDSTYTGSSDIYVAKFTLAGGGSSDLLYSTYLGGSTDFERSTGIDVDATGKVYVVGPAFSGHPTTAGAFQTTMGGSSDAFLTVLDTTVSGSSGLVYSTLIGGAGSEQANDVYYRAADGYVYVVGRTSSTDFGTTTGAYMESSGGGYDGFLTIIDPSGGGASDLVYGSYLGGGGLDYIEGLDVDTSGVAYVTGYTAGGLPTVNPTQGTYGGGTYDAFVAALNPLASGSSDLTFSTFLGGSGTDYSHDIVVDPAGNLYVAGYVASAAFPTTTGAYDETANGGNDAFVAKLSGFASPAIADSLWISTKDDVSSPSGAPGLDSWTEGEVLEFGDPGLAFEPAGTSGTFSSVFDLNGYFDDGDVDVNALHYVGSDITVGSGANTYDLFTGDVLFALESDEQIGGVWYYDNDIHVFRPNTPGNYGSGTITVLLDTLSTYDTRAITLVEQDVFVGDVMLKAGEFLYADNNFTGEIRHFDATGVGKGTTTGTRQTFIDSGGPFGLTEEIVGLELIEVATTIGGKTLAAGALLASVGVDDTVGDNGLNVADEDVFSLTVSQTKLGSGTSSANAALFMDGSAVNLTSSAEDITALSLHSPLPANDPPTDIAPNSVSVNENTDTAAGYSVGTLTTTDPDAGDTFTYSIVGGADQAKFSIGGAGNDELILTDGVLDFEAKPSYSVTVRVTDSGGLTYDETLTVTINDLNEAPTDITPNSFNVDENIDTSGGHSLGALTSTDEDGGETFTYSIVGGADAGSFSIGGAGSDELILTDGTLDFETQSTYTVIVRTTDSGGLTYDETLTVNVNDLNETPTDIAPNSFNVDENIDTSGGHSLGALTSTDEDGGDTFSYSIVGGADAGSFSIGGAGSDELILTDGTLDFETQSTYTVIVRTTDSGGLTYDETLTVNVNDLNEAPTDITPNSFNVDENIDTSGGHSLGALTSTDEDGGETFSYSIVGGADAGSFSIGGAGSDELILTDGTLDFETQSTYTVIVRTTDSGGLTYDETLTVNVNDLNEAPTDIAPSSFNVNENTDTSGGHSLGALTSTDEDGGDTFSYSIVGGADAGSFSIGGTGSDELILTDGTLDFETQSTYTVIVRTTDSGGLTYDETLTVNVNDLNEAPTDIAPNSFNVDENTDTSGGHNLGALTSTDEDGGETFSYSIVGGADAGSFSIGGAGSDELILTDGTLDFETQSTYTVIVRTTDSGGLTYDETLTVNVNDLNETPTDIAPNSFSVDDDTDTSSGFSVGTLTTTDEDSGDTFSYTIIGGADAGVFSIGGAGSDELILADGVVDFETKSSYTVVVRVTDSGGLTYDESLTVNVNDLNEAPTDIAPNSFNVDENTDTSGGYSVGALTATDEDSGETFSYSIVGGPDGGVFSIGGAGSDELILTDGILDFETQSTYSVIVRVTDSGGLTYDETLTVNVNDLNETPTDIAPNSFNVDENIDTSGGYSLGALTSTDEDVGDTFTYSIVGGADAALFSIGGAGSDELILTDGTLDFETQSSYTVIVRTTDSGGLTYDETLTVNVNDLNEAPTDIAPNSFNVDENTDTSGGHNLGALTSTDEDGGETFSYSIVGGADAGSFSIGGAGSDELILTDGTLDFETQSSYTVILRTTDSGGLTYDDTLTVNVNDLNETPTDIAPNSFNVNDNTDTSSGFSVGALTTTDEDSGDTSSYTIVGGADAGVFSIGGAGSDELILTDGVTDFETKSSYTVVVRVTDSGGLTYDESLTVVVDDVNEAPTDIAPNSFNVDENTDTSGGYSVGALTATDEDSGETFSYSIVGGPDSGVFSIGGAGSDELILTDGILDFETQSTYSVIVRVTDSGGLTYDETLTVNVNDLNETPTDIAPNSFAVDENTDTSSGYSVGALTTSDEDAGDTFSYSIVGGVDAGVFSIGGAGSDELILTDGILDFETQSSYTVIVRVTDSGGLTYDETLTVNVNDLNESPTDIAPNSLAVDENIDSTGGFSVGTLTATDEDGGETFSYSIVGGADAGVFTIGGAGSDELVLTDGVLDFETQPSYIVIVRVTDSGGLTYDETLTVNVNDLNETPTDISPNSFAVNENTDTTGGFSVGVLTATDEDSGETFSYSIVGGADAGVFSIGGAGSDELILADGILDFETQSSYTVIVRVTDSGGLTYDETLTVNVNDLNETPTDIAPNSFAVDENIDSSGGYSVGTLTTTDEDGSETFSYSIVGGADAGVFSIGGAGSNELILTDGILDFETQSSYAVIVRVTDSGGLTYDEMLTVTVNDLNETPTDIAPNNFGVNENTDTSSGFSIGTLTATDEDGGETFSYSIVGGADAAVFSIGGAGSDELILTEGVLDFESQSTYSVIVRVTDSGGLTYDETLTVNVNDLNETPTDITPNSFNVDENTDTSSGYSVGALTTTDEDAGDTFSYSIVGGVDAGVFSIGGTGSDELILTDGVLDFETQSSYTLIVRVTDSGGLTYDETLTVNVNDLNEAPTDIAPNSFAVNENTDTTSGYSAGILTATDEDGAETFSYSIVGGADASAFSIGGAGSDELILSDGVLDFETQSSYTVIVRVTDSGGLTYDETLTVNVNDINEAPVAGDDSFALNEGDTFNGASSVLLGNDSDPEGAPLNVTLISDVSNGTLTLNSDGSFTYVHDGSETTSDSFQYRVDDGVHNSNVATVTINVVPVNDAPIGNPDSYTINAGDVLNAVMGVLGNDTDAELDALNAILVSPAADGTVALNPDGSFTYAPDSGFFGVDSFSYVPNDGLDSGNVTVVTINVSAVAPPDEGADGGDDDNDNETETEEDDGDDDDSDATDDLDVLVPIDPVSRVQLIQASDSDGRPFHKQFGNLEDLSALAINEDLSGSINQDEAELVLQMILDGISGDAVDRIRDSRELRALTQFEVSFDANYLWNATDEDDTGRISLEDVRSTAGAITAVGALGYVVWTLRGGVLAAAALAHFPTWQMIDPLPVLDSYAMAKKVKTDELDEYFG